MEKLKNNRKFNNIIQLLPIVVFSALVPLIVYAKYLHLDDFTASHWLGQAVYTNIFTFYKSILIMACAAAALVLMIYNLIRRRSKIQLSFALIIALAYMLLIVLSTIFSDYPATALWGSPERYEGMFVLLSYIIIFIYTLSVVDCIKKVHIILSSILVSSVIVGIISALQFLGVNIFIVNLFRNLLNINSTPAHPYEVTIVHSTYRSYSTMGNPNNLGVYITLVFPLAAALYATYKSKKALLASAFIIYLIALSVFGAVSAGGYYAVIAGVILLVILSSRYIKNNLVNIVLLAVIVLGMILITNIFTDNRIGEKFNLLSASSEVALAEKQSKLIYISDIVLGEDEVFIDTTDKDFTVRNHDQTISVVDPLGKEIPVFVFDEGEEDSFKGNIIPFSDPEYRDYLITTTDDYSIFLVRAGSRVMNFYMTEEGIRVPGMNGELYTLNPIERNELLYNYPQLFSGRGYIWSAMLPLLRDTAILGHGPDTTFLTYPQDDFIGKINMTGMHTVVIAKPHCYYIQLAHDTGWISLILLLSLFGYYFIDTIILLIKNKRGGKWRIYSIASLCGFTAYLIASIMYDSSVVTAPVFWTILAIGISLNSIGRKPVPVSEVGDPIPENTELS